MKNMFEKVSEFICGRTCKLMCFGMSVMSGIMKYVPICMASEADDIAQQVTQPMNTLLSVVLAVLACVGAYILVKAVTELINAIQQQDNSGIFHAGRGIAAGLLLISIKLIMKLFGYTF